MPQEHNSKETDQHNEFVQAGQENDLSIIKEFYLWMKENKKWWILPIVLAIGIMGLLVTLGSTGAAPFIYTLF